MPNPFKILKEQAKLDKLLADGFEEIEGAMSCQTQGCKETVTDGYYSASAKLLTWKCPNGHVSKIENFIA